MNLLKHFKITANQKLEKKMCNAHKVIRPCPFYYVSGNHTFSSFFLRFLIITDHFLKSPELVKVMYAKMSNQER